MDDNDVSFYQAIDNRNVVSSGEREVAEEELPPQ